MILDQEKALLEAHYALPAPDAVSPRRSRLSQSFKLLCVSLLCFAALTWRTDKHHGHGHHHLKYENQTDFASAPRGEVVWYDCGDAEAFPAPFRCGRMKAPLDYTNASDERNASVAVIMYPAGAGRTPKSDILGSLLTNPGGPGGSGVDFLRRRSTPDSFNNTLAGWYDELLDSRYNIVSFDPRGVSRTFPRTDCYNNTRNSYLSGIEYGSMGVPSSHVGGLDSEYGALMAHNDLGAQLCAANEDLASLLRFVGTPAVARDMRLLHQALGDEKIHYWGFSYGSVLGSVFADMFPKDVARLVIDGVCDVPNYLDGLWSRNFMDIDGTFDGFFVECAKAGPDACALATRSEDWKELKRMTMELLEDLKLHPRPAVKAKVPQLVTYSVVYEAIFNALYKPKSWPDLASQLHSLINGDATAAADAMGDKLYVPPTAPESKQAQMSIACGDVLSNATEHYWSIDEFRQSLVPIQKDSKMFAHSFGEIAHACLSSWKIRAVERHHGDFTSNTSFPLLALGNDYDNVTPGSNADLMAGKFGSAVSVRRAGYGHCSLSQPSRCINQVVRGYFVDGVVPKNGTRCDVDEDKPIFAPEHHETDAITEALREFNRF